MLSRNPTNKLNQQNAVYKVPLSMSQSIFWTNKTEMGTRLKEHQGQPRQAAKTNKVKKDKHDFQWD